MIYWEMIKDFESACKIVQFMTWIEFESVLHGLEAYPEANDEQWNFLHRACKHVSSLRKLGKVHDKKIGRLKDYHPKFRLFPGFKYVEIYEGTKKICGYNIKGLPAGILCHRKAGVGTNHVGFGYCAEHEAMENPEVRKQLWIKLRMVHNNVPTVGDLLKRAEEIEEFAVESMSADLSYLEIARQAIMKKIEDNQGIPLREHTADLTYISEVMAKVKGLKVKTEALNWVPPEQVIAIMLQVMDAVTAAESPEVRARIAERAKDIGNILVPRIQSANPEIPNHKAQADVKTALVKAGNYVGKNVQFADIPEVSGYTIPVPEKPEPAYKRNHKFLRRDAKSQDNSSNK